jgi:uncharacterized NAD(P)/FAD-binding protein YdhS
MKADFIIVGQGLAGTLLVPELLSHLPNWKFEIQMVERRSARG